MNKELENIFQLPEKQNLVFDFWYLLKNAPKHTDSLVKWCGYPFVFLCGVFGVASLLGDIIKLLTEGTQNGIPIIGILIALMNIGIALLIWVGSGWYGQKKEGLFNINQAFKKQFDSLAESKWDFNLFGENDIKDSVSKLSRGNKVIPTFENVFSLEGNHWKYYVGDIIRVEHTSNASQGYRENFSCIYIQTSFPDHKSKLVLTKISEIEQWLTNHIKLSLSKLLPYIDTLRVNQSGVIIEFKETISDPNKKLLITQFIDSQPIAIANTPDNNKDKINLEDSTDNYHYVYNEMAEFKDLFSTLTYDEGEFIFKFVVEESDKDPMEVEDTIYLNFSIEKKTQEGTTPITKSIYLDEFSYWFGMEESDTPDFPYYWDKLCKRTVQLLIKACQEHTYQEGISAEAYYVERLSKINSISFSHPISDLNKKVYSKIQPAFEAAEKEDYKLIDLLLTHNYHSLRSRILTKVGINDTHNTLLGNIRLEYISITHQEQNKKKAQVTFNAYLRNDTSDDLMYSKARVVSINYTPGSLTKENITNYIDAIDEFEYQIISNLKLNISTEIPQYLIKFFSTN